MKYIAFIAFCSALIGGYWLDKPIITGPWNAANAQTGGVFQGGQKFVTITTASTNCQTIAIPGPHQILEISLINTSATPMYLHLYDIAVAPAAGALPGQIGIYAAAGGTVTAPDDQEFQFGSLGASVANGIGFCVTGSFALADTTVAGAGGIVNWTVK